MTHALPLWTLSGPRFGSWKWLRLICLTALLSICLVVAGCSFASVAAALEEDIPVILQMITNITTIMAPGVSGEVTTAGALAMTALQIICGTPAIGATKCDATSLVGQYQASPSTTILQKIDAALATANSHINAMLAAAKGISSAVGAAIVTAIGLALATVTSLMSLMPAATMALAGNAQATALASKATLPPRAKVLKMTFNAVVSPQFPLAVVH